MTVTLVTGGSRGIGAAVVANLAAAGHEVAFCFKSDTAAAHNVAASTGSPSPIVPVQIDLAAPEGPNLLVQTVLERLGRIDALVVNAGISIDSPLLEMTPETYDSIVSLNTRASYFLVQAVARHMVERGQGGRMVIVTSRGARRPRPGSSAYSMSKAAQVTLTQSAAIELAPYGITVNEVAPGPTETDINLEYRLDPVKSAQLRGMIPLGRFGKPHEVANAVNFLLSDEAAFITGATVTVDGGASISPQTAMLQTVATT